MSGPRCTRCYGPTEVEPCDDWQEASDRSESFAATHRCKRCGEKFRYTPPDMPFNPIRLSPGHS